jgi:hypothetical protein
LSADLGLPPRLEAWLAKHKGGDIRRAARVALSGVAARNERTKCDADGHMRLGGDRPKYKPLNERRVEVQPIARPVPRYEFEPPPTEQQFKQQQEQQLNGGWDAEKGKVVKLNVAVSAEAKSAVRLFIVFIMATATSILRLPCLVSCFKRHPGHVRHGILHLETPDSHILIQTPPCDVAEHCVPGPEPRWSRLCGPGGRQTFRRGPGRPTATSRCQRRLKVVMEGSVTNRFPT